MYANNSSSIPLQFCNDFVYIYITELWLLRNLSDEAVQGFSILPVYAQSYCHNHRVNISRMYDKQSTLL